MSSPSPIHLAQPCASVSPGGPASPVTMATGGCSPGSGTQGTTSNTEVAARQHPFPALGIMEVEYLMGWEMSCSVCCEIGVTSAGDRAGREK